MWGAFEASWALAAVAVTGVVLSAGYLLWYYERAFFGPAGSTRIKTLRDLNTRETTAMGMVLALVIAIGVSPMPLINITSASTTALAERLSERSRSVSAAVEPPATAPVTDPTEKIRHRPHQLQTKHIWQRCVQFLSKMKLQPQIQGILCASQSVNNFVASVVFFGFNRGCAHLFEHFGAEHSRHNLEEPTP